MPSLLSEGHAQFGKERPSFLVRFCGRHDRNIEPHHLLNFIKVDFRENNLLRQTKREIPMPIKSIAEAVAESTRYFTPDSSERLR